jgi:RNA polymerase sigma-70 factor (ECF subfamily)
LAENSKLNDIEIMHQVAGYDSKALEQLYDRYSPLLFTLIKKVIGDTQSAEEVLSDIFVIIWRKSSQLELTADNIYTLLVTLTRNKAVDVVRRKRGYENMLAYTDGYEDKFILPRLSKNIESLDLDKVLGMSGKIKDSFNNLTDAQKYVIELSFYDGFEDKEIAKKLNIPFPTVKTKLQVALGMLHQKLFDGKPAQGKNTLIEQIKAHVIGCLNSDELSALNTVMETDENFPWKELGEYQNLAAMLPAALEIELPVTGLKDKVARKLYSIKDEILAKQKKELPPEELIEEIAEIKEEKKLPPPLKEEGISFKERDLSRIHIPSRPDIDYTTEERSLRPDLKSKHSAAKTEIIDKEAIERTVKEYISTHYQAELELIQKGIKRNFLVSIAFIVVVLILMVLMFLK